MQKVLLICTLGGLLVAAMSNLCNPVLAASKERQASEQKYIKVPVKRKPTDKEWKFRDTRTIELLNGFRPGSKKITYNQYGGRIDCKAEAKGFFYPKKLADRWWFIDPDGHLYINVGVCSIRRGKSQISQKPAMEIFGTWEKWAQFTTSLLAGHGFNGIGGWSDTEFLRSTSQPLAYTLSWNFMGSFGRSKKLVWQESGHLGYPNRCIPVFHPDFEKFCDEYAKQLLATKNDPWLIGHFSDNEMPIVSDMLDRSLQLDVNNPDLRYGCEAAQKWLNQRKAKQASSKDITDADRQAFIVYAFDQYYRITTNAIRKYDSNHLCLGSRLHGRALRLPYIFKVAGKYLDVVAVNCYGAWQPDPERMAMWSRESGKPFIITEFYAKGHDSGLANNSGAGWLVPTQKDRGRFYQNFTLGLLESKSCVGWHWFKYRDNNPEDLSTDPSNRDSNKGIIDYRYKPYATLLEDMKKLNNNVYALIDYFDSN
ncbi:MAG: agarase [Planctomycetes bacterium]|nr:agarase [Planctomycetota bacterium]